MADTPGSSAGGRAASGRTGYLGYLINRCGSSSRTALVRTVPAGRYLSRIIVTGPSLTRCTSIIVPKRPVSTWDTPIARSRSQK
jgi:hypothetical protein